ncbi:two-component system sensor histidine kinase NtrB [Maridesulfovibrio sp. FT414]|uniref:two-component system sensor histidine kinase NtrB n=1 Tax=Maridesulfovibrio sp. FT414 TaxID=2979469 RepID=UPI003D8026DB
MKNRFKISSVAIQIAAVYALFGFLWILLSDKLLLFLVRDIDTVNRLQTYKGWFYVLVTAALVCLLIEKHIRTLQLSEQRYRRLLSNIADPIYLANSKGEMVDCNSAATTRLGYTRSELLSMKLDEIDLYVNIDVWIKIISEMKNDRKFPLESLHRCKDGTTFPVEISACVFDEGEERFVLGVARDITERKQTLELLVQTEKMNSLGNMAAGIAHEINNPLSAILGACQNIRNRVFKDTLKNMETANECHIELECLREYFNKRDVTRMLDAIAASGERASKIVTSMLNFCYSSPVELHVCKITTLLDETIELISADFNLIKEYDFRHIQIIRDYPEQDLQVCCLRSAIQQVFLNLFKNATEAMAEKTYEQDVQPQITLRVRQQKDNVSITVEDNGPGMNKEMLKKIFEPFYTSKDVGKGTGLGLSVSYFIVTDQHKGNMEVESTPGRGTKFIITLPQEACSIAS